MSKQIQEAYIVAATRLPVAKKNGMFKHVRPDDMLAFAIRSVLAQAPGLDPARIGDVIVGCAMPEAEQGMNVARIGLLLAGLPYTVPGMTINRFCSSGVQAVALGRQVLQPAFQVLRARLAGGELIHGQPQLQPRQACSRRPTARTRARGPPRDPASQPDGPRLQAAPEADHHGCIHHRRSA